VRIKLAILGFFVFLAPVSYHLPNAEAQDLPGAEVSFRGRSLFTLYSRVGSFFPADRARMTEERLASIYRDPAFPLESITSSFGDQSADILGRDIVIVTLTPEDALKNHHPLPELATEVARKIRESLEDERRKNSPRELALGALYALLSTLILLVLLYLLFRLTKTIMVVINSHRGKEIHSLKVGNFELLSEDKVSAGLGSLVKFFRLAVVLLTLYFYVPLVLSFFPLTAGLTPRLLSYLFDPIRAIGKSLLTVIPNLIVIGVILVGTRYVLSFARFFFDQMEAGKIIFSGFYPDWASPTYKLVRLLILAITIVVVFPYIPGSSSPAFQAVSVFLGLLFSFGSSSTISSVISGVLLTYMRPFRIGDRVKIADTEGDVVEKTFLVTRVRTPKNVDVTIPNSLVLGSHIINFSSSSQYGGMILHTEVTIGYDAHWRKVHGLLIEAAGRTPGVLSSPPPFVLQTGLDDSYVRYEINAYTHDPHRMPYLYAELRENIQDAFNTAGVEILSPSYRSFRDGSATTIPSTDLPG